MAFFYSLGVRLYVLLIRMAAFAGIKKARLWYEGRYNWRQRYQFQKTGPVLWLHAASLGEFEQGRPILEAVREQYSGWQIVLTFFSPSGYEIRKNYSGADAVFYLPYDSKKNAQDFIALIKPDVVIFVKYEFWAFYLRALKQNGIPVMLVSAVFRPGQPFFKAWGGFWRSLLSCFTKIYVQNESSALLLERLGYTGVTVAGDNRIDRVLQLAEGAPDRPLFENFAENKPVIIAGSSWPADERVFLPSVNDPQLAHYKWIIAPHQPSEAHLVALENQLTVPTVRYSALTLAAAAEYRVVLIDNIGMLNTLYRFGKVAYIGGGFGKSIHNTLEPAAFGLPVVFGPRFQRFDEARAFVASGGGFSVTTAEGFRQIILSLEHEANYQKASRAVREYLQRSRGATALVMSGLKPILQIHSPT